MSRLLSVPLLVALLAPPAALAEEPAPKPAAPAEDPSAVTGDATVTFASAYVFRGFRYGQDSVVVQPAANLSYRGFTLGFWANVDTDQKDTPNFVAPTPGERELNEADLNLSYGREVGPVKLSGGWLYYGTKYAPETEELFVSAAVGVPGTPTLTVFRDIRSFAGWYATLGLSHELALASAVGLELSAAAGFYALDEGGYEALHDGLVKAKLSFALPEGFSVRPWAAYSFPLSSKAEDEALIEGTFIGAVDLTREF